MAEQIPTEAQIDRGAQALRELQMKGRITRLWAALPKSDSKKWRVAAEAVLRAALQEADHG
jgi:hypothetical protein